MTHTIFATSSRLDLRQLDKNDLKTMFVYRNDPTIGFFQSWSHKTENQLHELIQEQIQLTPGIPGEWYVFAIQLKENNTMIGDCAFVISKDDPQQAEIGITLSPHFQGKGLAREAVTCVIHYAFENFPIERIVMITNEKNTRSINLIKKAGLHVVDPKNKYKNKISDRDFFVMKDDEVIFEIRRDYDSD